MRVLASLELIWNVEHRPASGSLLPLFLRDGPKHEIGWFFLPLPCV